MRSPYPFSFDPSNSSIEDLDLSAVKTLRNSTSSEIELFYVNSGGDVAVSVADGTAFALAKKSDLGGMTIVQATSVDQINENGIKNTYRIMYFMDASASYISFDVNWIRIQFKATGRDALHWRIIYGDTVGSWYQLSTT